MPQHPTDHPDCTYIGNRNTNEVHRLTNETMPCQLDSVFRTGHAVGSPSNNLTEAKPLGYHCFDGSPQ